eukprot:298230-Rhodomonas_salina.1
MSVSIDGTVILSLLPETEYEAFAVTFTASAPTSTLLFENDSPGPWWRSIFIDAVSIERVAGPGGAAEAGCEARPEPPTAVV